MRLILQRGEAGGEGAGGLSGGPGEAEEPANQGSPHWLEPGPLVGNLRALALSPFSASCFLLLLLLPSAVWKQKS